MKDFSLVLVIYSSTDKDLLFVDMDIDTKPEDIKFESRATPNGELVYTEDPSKRVSLSNIVIKSLNLCHKVFQSLSPHLLGPR